MSSNGREQLTADPYELHRDAVVVDCHNDIAMSLLLHHLHGDRATLRHRWIPELRDGGVDVQVMPIYVDPEYPEAALRQSLQMLQRVVDEIDANPDEVALCLDGEEVDRALAAGRIAMVLALEGFSYAGLDLGLVRTFHRLGVRMISFTHFGRTLLADGSAEEDTGGRLTRAGVAVLREMERLGIQMDVSHLSEAGTDHVLELSTRPVIASHSNARAIRDHHRNLPDRQLRAIAATGGVVGLNLLPALVDPERPTLDRVMAHLDHLLEVAGADHVGLGPDFTVDLFNERYPAEVTLLMEGLDVRQAVAGLVNARGLPLVTELMVRAGYPEPDIRKVLGENFLRVFRQTLGRGAVPAQQPAR